MKLRINNPSGEARGGPVTVPWSRLSKEFGEQPVGLVVRTDWGGEVASQVDPIDPGDPSRAQLAFRLSRLIQADGTDQVTVTRGRASSGSGCNVRQYNSLGAVEMYNGRLVLCLSLHPATGAGSKECFAGAAVSARLHWLEMLDPLESRFFTWRGHDAEKRCMQVDRLRVLTPGPGGDGEREIGLFDQGYELVSHSSGPVRATTTIRSRPLTCVGAGPDGRPHETECRLYRVISLYAGAEWAEEELFVAAASRDREPGATLSFAARYFASVRMGLMPSVSFRQIPGGFAGGYDSVPYHGYGFVTDAAAAPVVYPHEGDPRRFSWWVGPTESARAVHVFTAECPGEVDARTSRCWNERISTPLSVV